MDDQVPTAFTTIASVMKSAAFRRGVDDVRSKRRPNFDPPADEDWDYERGRLFATLAPLDLQIMKGRGVNKAAEILFRKAFSRKEII